MNSPSTLPDAAAPPGLDVKFWVGCATALALLLALAAATAYPRGPPRTSQVAKPALMKPQPLDAMAQGGRPDAPAPVDLYRFALNAFLAPMLDDSNPTRCSDAALDPVGEPGTTVLVDGEPLVSGKPIPAKAFTVRWQMDRCSPLGPQSVELTGAVALLVFQTGHGLSAIVMPDGLRVDSHLGRTWMHGQFAAETSLAASTARGREWPNEESVRSCFNRHGPTLTPFQNATRPRTISASGFGSA